MLDRAMAAWIQEVKYYRSHFRKILSTAMLQSGNDYLLITVSPALETKVKPSFLPNQQIKPN